MSNSIFYGRSIQVPMNFSGENFLVNLSLFRLPNEETESRCSVHVVQNTGEVKELKLCLSNGLWADSNGEIFDFVDDVLSLSRELGISFKALEPREFGVNHG